MLVYIDEIIVMGNDSSLLHSLISSLRGKFLLRDLGTLSFFLGIHVSIFCDGLHLCQVKYITDLLKRVEIVDSKSCSPTITMLVLHVLLQTPLCINKQNILR